MMQSRTSHQQEVFPLDTQSTLSTSAQKLQTPELEDLLVVLWSKELGIDQIGISQNFFDLGSKSLTVRCIQVKLQQFLQRSIPITVFFARPTIKQLAYYLIHEG